MSAPSTLDALGWDDRLQAEFAPHATRGFEPARVVAEHRGGYLVRGEHGERLAAVRGRLRDGEILGLMPTVGDWVAACDAGGGRSAIEAVLPRRTSVSRKTPWLKSEEQVMAANVDLILVVTGLDGDLSPRRLERYLATASTTGADPVVVLTKLDLCRDAGQVSAAVSVACGVPVIAVSNVTLDGLDEVEAVLEPRRTAVLLGSSGVGKSTLLNELARRRLMPTGALRRDGRGRHTTRHRQLVALPWGALVIDTPGLRELQLWEGDLDAAFEDISSLAESCRFRNCAHETEPGCAVREALESGDLDDERWRSYLRLGRELAAVEGRRNARVHRELKRRWRERTREARAARRHGRTR